MKKTISIIIGILLLASIVTGVVYEDQYAILTVEPDTAGFKTGGYFQEAELCSKVNSTESISISYLFERPLTSASIRYGSIDISDLFIYNQLNPRNYGFASDKRNSYRIENIIFQPYECKSWDYNYQTMGSGKWDLVAWTGNILSPTMTWLLDPFYNASVYNNDFNSALDLNDIANSTNLTIS